MTRTELAEKVALAHALADRAARSSLREGMKHYVINSSPSPRSYGQVAEPWQWAMLDALGPAIESVAGLPTPYAGPRSFWFTLPRGHDKTGLIGRILNWALTYARKRLSLATAAMDSDQAQLIVESMDIEYRLNPWMGEKIYHGKRAVKGPGGTLKVLNADASGSSGLNCDLIVCDELTHWKKKDLFDVLWSGREKRRGSVFIVITNAGTRQSWQHEVLAKARTDPRWHVYETPPNVRLASWMDEQAVAALRKLLTRGLARRVLDNVWTDAAEEADYLTRDEIRRCAELGRELNLHRQHKGTPGHRYVAAIDYGPRRDRTCCVIGHRDGQGRVVVDRMDVWQGSPEAPVPVQVVDTWIGRTIDDFPGISVVCDPYQLEGTVQKYETSRCQVRRFEARGGKANYEMAENLRSLISSTLIAWGPDVAVSPAVPETLEDELAGLVVRIMPYGYRFDHTAGCHDDRAVALGMLALELSQQDPSGPGLVPEGESPFWQLLTWRDYAHGLVPPREGRHLVRGLWGTGRGR